ncbi:hypothetical protein H0H92_010951 [Tricholoma furcatifolium]|nr:hypothetical protein H0H92_010951 [Tricholoma furcatifolium]
MAPKSQANSKQLRQTTLFDSRKASRASSSLPTPSRLKRKRASKDSNPSEDSDEDNAGISSIKFTPKKLDHSASNSEDGDSVVAAPPKRLKSIIIDSDDSDRVIERRKPVKKKKPVFRPSDDAEQPKRRKLKKKRDVALVSTTDDEDLAEEVEKKHIIQNRLRTRGKKTAFQKNLERLKKRKQGKRAESSSPSSEEESHSSSGNEAPLKGAMPSSEYDSLFDGDSEDNSDDFIVEDDNPGVALPMEFSMESHEDLDYQFKKIFQFFVHIAVRPAKERHYFMKDQIQKEQYFSMPLQMVRRKLSGLRDSLVASSVWRPEFKKSLATYPRFELLPLSFAVPSCDACHLGARMSTLLGRLSGFPYDPLGWEVKDKAQTYSSESDNKSSDDDSDNRSTEETSTVEFHLGRFCARRVRVYHEFTHWEQYSLFKVIRDEVDELHENRQSNGFFRIAYAGGKKPPKDLDDADGICDWLDSRKVIDMEWVKIKDMMERANHLELDSKKGDDD